MPTFDSTPCSCGIAIEGHRCAPVQDPALVELRRRVCERLEAGLIELPVLEEIATRLLWLSSQLATTGPDLAKVVEREPELAAKLELLSNSPTYRGKYPIYGTDRAVTRLGVEMVASFTIGSASEKTFRSTDDEYHALLRSCWKKSVYAAAAGELLAPYADARPELGHLAGLMHTIGEPVLVVGIEALIENGIVARPNPSDLHAAIDPLTPVAAKILVERWKLPAILGVALEQHRRQAATQDSRAEKLAALIRASAAISCHCVCGHAPRPVPDADRFRDTLTLDQDGFEEIAERARLQGDVLLGIYDSQNDAPQQYLSMCCPEGSRQCAGCSPGKGECRDTAATDLLEIRSEPDRRQPAN
ncbi:hypothetical protein ABI59_16960 [Acidobacteria bacterium Mor1]|nr:hypothetical protein ABI59_16960 [Acidobacteria bacterium Mor1]